MLREWLGNLAGGASFGAYRGPHGERYRSRLLSSCHPCGYLCSRLRNSFRAKLSSVRKLRCPASDSTSAARSRATSSASELPAPIVSICRASLGMCCHAITRAAIAIPAIAVRRKARNRTPRGSALVKMVASASGPTSRSRRCRRSGALSRSRWASSNARGSPQGAFLRRNPSG